MRSATRPIAILLLAAVILAGTTGISFLLHHCNSSNRSEITLLTATGQGEGVACSCHNGHHLLPGETQPATAVGKSSCCTEKNLLLKIPVYQVVEKNKATKARPVIIFARMNSLTGQVRALCHLNPDRPSILPESPPPAHPARPFLFFRQLRIPSPDPAPTA